MSNANIVKRISDASALYESGKLSASDLEKEIRDHATALDTLSEKNRQLFRDFEARIVRADASDAEYPGEDIKVVLSEFRAWLGTL